jgi:isopentenyl phosphate kinase
MKTLVLIKLGGSLVTDKTKPFTAREDMIRMVAKSVRLAREKFPAAAFLVANGGGSFGHYLASVHADAGDENADKFRISEIHQSVLRLNMLVAQEFAKENVPAFSISPSACITYREGKLESVSPAPLFSLLGEGFVPLTHGDILPDGTQKGFILSTETQFEILAKEMQGAFEEIHAVYLGEVPGLLDDRNECISEVSATKWQDLGGIIKAPQGYDVTGGMLHKIESALRMTALAKSVRIISGKDASNIARALAGEVIGTRVVP